MSSILEHYKLLGVSVGAGIADVASSYRRLCRIHHPDVSDDPESEELMKRINIAYSALRDKLRREAAFQQRQSYYRQTRRYPPPETRTDPRTDKRRKGADAEAQRAAYSVLHDYFKAISMGDYLGAYNYLSSHDRKQITREGFIQWRKSVARLYPMREFMIAGGQAGIRLTFGEGRLYTACKFKVLVTEDDIAEGSMQSGDVEKIVINEHGLWRVYLGYTDIADLTRGFDERFEANRKRDIAKRWEEHYAGLCPEYDMLSASGMRKAVAREIYRQKRYGGTLTFAVIAVKTGSAKANNHDEILRSAAQTIVGTLRETDIPAYAGDGVFAILYVGLRKKDAEGTIVRLIAKIKKDARPQPGQRADIEYGLKSWTGQSLEDVDTLNKVLMRFRKKM